MFSRTQILALLVLTAFPVSKEGQGAAKKPPATTCGAPSTVTTPNPARPVVMTSVGTKVFSMPNGASIDLTTDLNSILNTALTQNSMLQPTDPAPPGQTDLCNSHLEMRAAVTSIDLNAFSAGVTFGYTPTGSTSVVSGVTGSASVSVGTIAMDFGVWQCVSGQCSEIVASHADQSTVSGSLSFTIDFGAITTGPSLVANTQLGSILRAIMNNGIQQLAASPYIANLPWMGTVQQYIPGAGLFYFNEGSQNGVGANQAFWVYALTSSTGICGALQPIASAHTTLVTAVSSAAVVDAVLDSSTAVQTGDVVMVRTVGQ